MSVGRNTSDVFACLLYLILKFMNNLKNTEYFNTHCKVSLYINKRFTIDNRWHIVSREIYS